MIQPTKNFIYLKIFRRKQTKKYIYFVLGLFDLGEWIMKKFLLTTLCAASAVYAGSFETWDAAKIYEEFLPNFQIHTGLGNGLETEGYWYSYNDNNNSGSSVIVWPVSTDLFYSNQSLDPVIEECKGLAGTAILSKGSYEHDPYVGAGFNIVGETSATNPAPDIGDASSWGGLCVTYMSDTDIALELGLGETVDSTINYANPTVTLPAAKTPDILSPNGTNGNKVVINWSDFKQPSWYNGAVKIDGETAAKQLAAVHFKIQAEPGKYNFNICAVGPKDGTCPEKCGMSSSGIQIARGISTVSAVLNGRTLGFTGFKASATVEVMNSLGQVVMKNVISNATTLNLATLNAGIYMIHVVDKTTNLIRKILLK